MCETGNEDMGSEKERGECSEPVDGSPAAGPFDVLVTNPRYKGLMLSDVIREMPRSREAREALKKLDSNAERSKMSEDVI